MNTCGIANKPCNNMVHVVLSGPHFSKSDDQDYYILSRGFRICLASLSAVMLGRRSLQGIFTVSTDWHDFVHQPTRSITPRCNIATSSKHQVFPKRKQELLGQYWHWPTNKKRFRIGEIHEISDLHLKTPFTMNGFMMIYDDLWFLSSLKLKGFSSYSRFIAFHGFSWLGVSVWSLGELHAESRLRRDT